jgi:hypothetical protein
MFQAENRKCSNSPHILCAARPFCFASRRLCCADFRPQFLLPSLCRILIVVEVYERIRGIPLTCVCGDTQLQVSALNLALSFTACQSIHELLECRVALAYQTPVRQATRLRGYQHCCNHSNTEHRDLCTSNLHFCSRTLISEFWFRPTLFRS